MASLRASANRFAISNQSYRAANRAALSSYLLRSAASFKSARIAAANAGAWSAIRQSFPLVTSNPSAPIDVEIKAFPIAMASKILSRVPPPILKGTTTMVAGRKYSATERTVPVTATEEEANLFTRG